MPVDSQLQNVLDLVNAAPAQQWTRESAPEFRTIFDSMLAMLGDGPASVTTEDLTIDGPGGDLALRVYRPEGVEQPPILVFFHGGGFVIGSIATHDRDCRYLAEGSGALVVSVEYRLAPEHPAPAASDDCLAALRWVAEHADELGADGTRIAVGGDSAGGNLSAVTALRALHEGGPALRFQLLVYPVVDMTPTLEEPGYDSLIANAEGYFLTLDDMLFFGDCYIPEGHDRAHPHLSPIKASSHEGLPPALVMTCEFDPLCDQGEAYAKTLADAGVVVSHSRYDGAIHGVMGMATITDIGKRFMDEAALAVAAGLR